MIARRRLFQLGFSALGAAAIGPSAHAQDDIIGALLEAQPPAPVTTVAVAQPALEAAPKWLSLHNLHTAEKLQAVYWEKGAYPMNVQLFDLLADIHHKTETRTAFQIISGYRSPASNRLLSARSGEVAKRSLHMDGKAMDIYLEDVALDRLRAAALDLKRGGVGYYPDSKFVHVDVGPFRRWQGS
ncbi:MAG: hypothetical protein B7Y81_04880 [Caulobacter sp. 32-67-35]|nr:MAG: hypothetical protein B7Y81_04880 [Caulobacter sp. 32-67-35]